MQAAAISTIQPQTSTKPVAAQPKIWCKRVTGVDVSQGTAYGILGDFINRAGVLPEGALILIGIRPPAGNSSMYVLARVSAGASFKLHIGSRIYSYEGMEQIANSLSPIKSQAVVEKYPELRDCMQRPIFPIFAALKDIGL